MPDNKTSNILKFKAKKRNNQPDETRLVDTEISLLTNDEIARQDELMAKLRVEMRREYGYE